MNNPTDTPLPDCVTARREPAGDDASGDPFLRELMWLEDTEEEGQDADQDVR